MDQERWVNEKEAATMLGLHRQTLSNWRHVQRGPAYARFGRACRYRLADLMNYAQSKRVEVRD